jgi:hypothetical protein
MPKNAAVSSIKIVSTLHYAFEPISAIIDPKFPKKIKLEDVDVFSQDCFKTQYLEAQKNGLPYYLLAIAELKSSQKDTPVVYQTYSSASLRAHKYQCLHEGKEFSCPVTRLPLQKVHYIALDCFKKKETSKNQFVFTPQKISHIKHGKLFYPDLYEPEGDVELALDALNHHISPENPESFSKLKLKQNIISGILKEKLSILEKQLEIQTHQARPSAKIVHNIKKIARHLGIEASKWEFCSRSVNLK